MLVGLFVSQANAVNITFDTNAFVEIMNSYKTVGEFTNDFVAHGFLSKDEQSAISTDLKEHGLTSDLPLGTLKLHEHTFTSGRLKMMIQDDVLTNDKTTVTMKTGDGHILKFDSNLRADKLFEKIFALYGEKSSAALEIVIPKAHANMFSTNAERAIRATEIVGYQALKLPAQFIASECSALTSTGLTLEHLVNWSKNHLINNQVFCGKNKEFLLHDPAVDAPVESQIREGMRALDAENARALATSRSKTVVPLASTASRATCKAFSSAWSAFFKAFGTPTKDGDSKVDPALVTAALADAPRKTCSPSTASVVTRVLSQTGSTVAEQVHNMHLGDHGSDAAYDESLREGPQNGRAAH